MALALENETTKIQASEVPIKTIHPVVNNVIAIISFGCLSALLSLLFGSMPNAKGLFIFFGAYFGAYHVAKLLSLSYTTLTFDKDLLTITSETQFLSFFRNTELNLTNILGYEIHQSKLFTKLIIYKKNGPLYVLTLTGTPKAVIENFFDGRIVLIDKKNPLSSNTFSQAFLKGISLLAGFWVIQFCFIALYQYLFFAEYHYYFPFSFTHIVKLAIINIFIILAFSHIFDRINLRIDGKYTGIFVLCLSFVLTAGAISFFEKHTYDNVRLNNPDEIFRNIRAKNFSFKHNLPVNNKIIGHLIQFKLSRKSAYNKFEQYFTTPVITHLANRRLWIGNQYTGKIKKNLDFEERHDAITAERVKNKFYFISSLEQHAHFYEVVYSGFNPSFHDKDYLYSAMATYQSINPLIVLRPHYESFEYYRQDLLNKTFYFLAGCIALLLIGGIVIGINR
jgi:hypothetical protein